MSLKYTCFKVLICINLSDTFPIQNYRKFIAFFHTCYRV